MKITWVTSCICTRIPSNFTRLLFEIFSFFYTFTRLFKYKVIRSLQLQIKIRRSSGKIFIGRSRAVGSIAWRVSFWLSSLSARGRTLVKSTLCLPTSMALTKIWRRTWHPERQQEQSWKALGYAHIIYDVGIFDSCEPDIPQGSPCARDVHFVESGTPDFQSQGWYLRRRDSFDRPYLLKCGLEVGLWHVTCLLL